MSFRVLTVGDGDLSFSLALKRAYPQITVTASTLVESHDELCRTYSNAKETSKEFQEVWNERIIYAADATKLEERGIAQSADEKFDIVLFNHPHLGDATLLECEQRHAERHYALLAHYFYSAKKLLKTDGRVHICLCGNQPKSWRVVLAGENNGLRCISEESTAYPIDKWLFKEDENNFELAEVQSHYPTKRKFRNGSLGSKHFLARYGYRHQRTEGDLFDGSVKHINVEQSINFVFEQVTTDGKSEEESFGGHICTVCKLKFDSSEQLSAHMDAPALPDVLTGAVHEKKGNTSQQSQLEPAKKKGKKEASSSPSFEPIKFEDATILFEATVSAEFDSKRIKWLCRQDGFPLAKYIKSKSQCEDAIKKGRVFVNQQVALDSGRIVRQNDVVTLAEEYAPTDSVHVANNDSSDLGVRFVKQIQSKDSDVTIEVVYKPVGIRCVGSFAPNTLEMITKKHAEGRGGFKEMCCEPVSKLDTGCAGLCVLATSMSKIKEEALQSLKVLYTFTALIHGQPPDEWKEGVYVKVPTEGLRRWKRQKTNPQHDGNEDCTSISIVTSSKELDLSDALFIKCNDSLQIEDQHASTLIVQSRFDDGRLANVISYVMRRLGYPVVNDRFGKREYLALPRRMKNIIKQKVCIGCYNVDVEYEGLSTAVGIERHKRTQCNYWRTELA